MDCPLNPERAKNISDSLLQWYDKNKRDLPWRHTREPYAVWVSEIMAQQTRISFLLSYYERFMSLFPTVRSLAEACEDEVLKAWEGLGYYARARNLQKAARKVTTDYGGLLPRTRKELMTLPGVGEYTAGAILSIAYDLPVPAVDGNVLRVHARLSNSDEDILLPQAKKKALDFVAAIMPVTRASCFSQALMELGALVCLPHRPACTVCPTADFCLALSCGRERELPHKAAKKRALTLQKTVLVIRGADGRILMRRRTEKMLSGLWEFLVLDAAVPLSQIGGTLRELGFEAERVEEIGASKHVFTHQIWLMTGYDCAITGGAAPAGYRWVAPEDVKRLAIPTALRLYTRYTG